MQCSTSSTDDIDVGKGTKTVEVLRVFNNNVVLAKDGKSEVISHWAWPWFPSCRGSIDESKVVRRFVPPTVVIRIIWRNCWQIFRLRSFDWSLKP